VCRTRESEELAKQFEMVMELGQIGSSSQIWVEGCRT
jgi:hypothetical protein